MRRASLTQCLCILLAILGLVDVTGATAQETPPAEPATAPNRATVSEVDRSSSADELSIPLAELKLLLRPLTVEELEKEAEAWHELVKSKAVEISTVEIAALRKEDVGIEKKLADLLQEEADLVNRFLVVLDSLQKKGGDVETYRRYLAAITDAALETVEVKQLWAFIVNWLRSPEGGLQIGKRLGMFILTLLVAYLVAQIVGMIVKRATSASKFMSDLLRDFLTTFTRRAILIVGLVMALSALGVDIGPLLAAVGAAGFAVAFALRDTLSNFASGIMILVYRPFDEGDSVEVAGVSGKVESLTLVSTEIRTPDNKVMFIPNNEIWQNVITNAVGSSRRRVDMVFGIGYEDSHEKAATILKDIVSNHELVLDDPEPVIKVHELADSSVNLICRPWAKTDDYWAVYWDVTRAVKERFDAEGVSIPFPQRDVHLYQAPAGA